MSAVSLVDHLFLFGRTDLYKVRQLLEGQLDFQAEVDKVLAARYPEDIFRPAESAQEQIAVLGIELEPVDVTGDASRDIYFHLLPVAHFLLPLPGGPRLVF